MVSKIEARDFNEFMRVISGLVDHGIQFNAINCYGVWTVEVKH